MNYSGSHKFFTESGLGTAFAVSSMPSTSLRALQQHLQSMGLLAAGTGPNGADGLWGPRTAAALEQARVRLGRATAAYTVSNAGRTVTIPDDFIAAITEASTPDAVLSTLPPNPESLAQRTTVDPGTTSSIPALPPTIEAGMSRTQKIVIGGSIAAVGTITAFFLFWPKTSTRNPRHSKRRRR